MNVPIERSSGYENGCSYGNEPYRKLLQSVNLHTIKIRHSTKHFQYITNVIDWLQINQVTNDGFHTIFMNQ